METKLAGTAVRGADVALQSSLHTGLGRAVLLQARSNLSKIECLPIDEFREGLARPFVQPTDQIGKNSLRVWRPFASFYVVNFKTEATELFHHVGNIFTGGLDP